MAPKDVYTAEELAKRLRVSQSTFVRWCQQGRVPPHVVTARRWGRVWSKADIDKWEADGFPVQAGFPVQGKA